MIKVDLIIAQLYLNIKLQSINHLFVDFYTSVYFHGYLENILKLDAL